MSRHYLHLLAVTVLVAGISVAISAQQESIEELRAKAEAGNAIAQFNLGVMYASGQGVPQDDAEAVRWYQLAADQGHAKAQNNLGIMYANGTGIPQDDAEAVRWLQLAADQGYAPAQTNLRLIRR